MKAAYVILAVATRLLIMLRLVGKFSCLLRTLSRSHLRNILLLDDFACAHLLLACEIMVQFGS